MLNRSVSISSLLVATLALGGCDSAVEEEHRDVAEAQSELAAAERKAAADKAEVNREAAEDRAELERPVTDAKEKVAEERAEAARAEELDRNDPRTFDARLQAVDDKLIYLKTALESRQGQARTDTKNLIADLERRRTSLEADLDRLKDKTGAALDASRMTLEDSLAKMIADIDAALGEEPSAAKR
jgi:DNA anti-recombination protein RmuC